MATIEPRKNQQGEIISYRITVAAGMDSSGRQIRRRMNWKPPKDNMTAKQLEKALNRAVADFEREIEQGYQLDNTQSFTEYANYVLDLKERTGLKPRTVDRYRDLMARIDKAIGHIKLADLRPQHLNAFYKNLAEHGIREDGERAKACIDIAVWLKKNHISRAGLARRANISAATVSAATQGKTISGKKAESIANAMGMKRSDVFKLQQDTTPLSTKTIQEYHRLISTIMAQAEKEMLVPYNPAAKATPPKVERKEPDYYQPEVVDAILDALDTAPLKWKTITYLLIDTGCRRGEAAGLKWDSVDLNTGIITIERALLYSAKRGVYEGSTKTGKSRTLKLAPETVSLLKRHRVAQIENRLAYGDAWVNSGYVFTQDNGERMNPDSITDWLGKFSAKNGLPHIHPHAFRHTAASTMIANGIDLVTAAAELGHANATTTANIYAHQIAEAKARATDARSGVFNHRKASQNDAENEEKAQA